MARVLSHGTLTVGAAAERPVQSSLPRQSVSDSFMVFLPMVSLGGSTRAGQLFHVPYFNVPNVLDPGAGRFAEMAVFWFGQLGRTSNYADVRIGYNDQALFVHVAVIDRLLWYNEQPAVGSLASWDSVSLYLERAGIGGDAPTATSYRFEAESAPAWLGRGGYQAAYRGNGSDWVAANIPFTTDGFYRGDGYNNDAENRGWTMGFTVPFSSLGLSSRPPDHQRWHLALVMHDRDDAAGTSIPDQRWPADMQPRRPVTWGNIAFGLPSFPPPVVGHVTTTRIRQGLNGITVPDGAVGGHSTCGSGLDFWTEWASHVYDGLDQFNIQNQRDIADWPCFSKYYVTFPLATIPANAIVTSATLTLHQFGNSQTDSGCPSPPYASLIQVLTVADDWNPSTLSWNNAPLAMENVSQAWVEPLPAFPGWPGVPTSWDVSQAVAGALPTGQPLRLALYSADSACHSGKYFVASETGDWNAVARPTLEVNWGTP